MDYHPIHGGGVEILLLASNSCLENRDELWLDGSLGGPYADFTFIPLTVDVKKIKSFNYTCCPSDCV